jgi:hypothetical protein
MCLKAAASTMGHCFFADEEVQDAKEIEKERVTLFTYRMNIDKSPAQVSTSSRTVTPLLGRRSVYQTSNVSALASEREI